MLAAAFGLAALVAAGFPPVDGVLVAWALTALAPLPALGAVGDGGRALAAALLVGCAFDPEVSERELSDVPLPGSLPGAPDGAPSALPEVDFASGPPSARRLDWSRPDRFWPLPLFVLLRAMAHPSG